MRSSRSSNENHANLQMKDTNPLQDYIWRLDMALNLNLCVQNVATLFIVCLVSKVLNFKLLTFQNQISFKNVFAPDRIFLKGYNYFTS